MKDLTSEELEHLSALWPLGNAGRMIVDKKSYLIYAVGPIENEETPDVDIIGKHIDGELFTEFITEHKIITIKKD